MEQPTPKGARSPRPTLYLLDAILLALVAFARFIPGLGEEAFRNWDEGLYCAATREMLREGYFLYAINEGLFDAYYGKPPLLNWLHLLSVKAFGFTPFALRLPSALAAAASVFFVHRIASRALGREAAAFAGVLLLLSLPFAEIGRQALIEPLLALFALIALGAHLRAIREDSRWAILSGLAVAASILAKQMIGTLPLCAILFTELALRRPEALRRIALSAGIGLGLSGIWFALVYAEVGGALFSSFIGDHLIGRATGAFESHGRRPIDYAQELELNLYHLPLIVALLGALRLLFREKTRVLGLLFVSYALGHYLIFGRISQNFLPWYLYAAIPAAALFAAALFTRETPLELRALLLGALAASVGFALRVDPIIAALGGLFFAALFELGPMERWAPTLLILLAAVVALGPLRPRPTEPVPERFLSQIDPASSVLLLETRYQFTYQCYLPEVEARVVGQGCTGIHQAINAPAGEATPRHVILAPRLSVCELHQRGYQLEDRQDGYRLYTKKARDDQPQ